MKKLLSLSLAALLAIGCFAACSPAKLTPLDFGTLLSSDSFADTSAMTTTNWNRTNLITTDVNTSATIATLSGENSPVIMLKGDSGTMDATGDTPVLTFDPAVNSQYASLLMMKDGKTASMGDGIYQFRLRVSSPADNVWNTQVVFRLDQPNKQIFDSSVTSALAVQIANGGDVQLVQNGGDAVSGGKLIADCNVNINDKAYHYFTIGMQDASAGKTNVRLWVDGNVVYTGEVDGLAKTGAIQLYSNTTPQYDASGTPLTATAHDGSVGPLTACGESYIGGYADGGQTISDFSLK